MAKRSHKRFARYEKVQSGCMWGLISIFGFRHGRFTRRLTSDSKRGNARHGVGHSRRRHNLLTNFDEKHDGIHHLSDNDESKGTKVECGKTSIKALMDGEMSKVQPSKKQIHSALVEHIRPDSEHKGWSEKNHRQTNKNGNVVYTQHCHDLVDSVSLEPHQTYHENSTEIFSAMIEFYTQNYPCQDVDQDHKNRNNSIPAQIHKFQMKGNQPKGNLSNAMEAFLNQKFFDEKLLNRDGALHQSKEFMDALEMLNSNKELFLELLQDPNSLFVQHIHDLRNARAEKQSKVEEETSDPRKNEEVVSHKHSQKGNIHNLFRRKSKPLETNPSNRIVVLKPTPASLQNPVTVTCGSCSTRGYSFENREKSVGVTSQFSLREIKRKLKNAIGESRMEIAERNVDTDLARKNSCQSERTSKFSTGSNRRNNRGKPREYQSSVDSDDLQGVANTKNLNITVVQAHRRESNICKEAKKHRAEMLNIEDKDENLATRQVRQSFGRIFSLPEYGMVSPNLSPRKDKVPGFVPEEIRYSPNKNFGSSSENIWWFRQENFACRLSPSRQNLESINCSVSNNPSVEVQELKANTEILKSSLPDNEAQESICLREESVDSTSKEIKDTMCMGDSNLLDVPPEPDMARSTTSTNDNIDVTEGCGNEDLFECSRLDSSAEKPQLGSQVASFSVSPLCIHEIETPESISEKLERPSPVSVLESFFSEDATSPASSVAKDAEFAMPRRINFEEEANSALRETTPEISVRTFTEDKESKFEYVRTVLKVSGFRCDEFKRMWHFSDQPLDPSLINEVETTSAQISEDHKLIFDCINEVLMEIYERHFSCSPWVSFIKPNPRPIPVGKNLVREVWEGIDWDLVPEFTHTLDQIIGKDIAKIGYWMDLRFEAECIGSDMEEAILEELMDETILELWT